MSKKKDFIEGIDYAITIRKRKKFTKNSKKNICPTCEKCNHKNVCLNRKIKKPWKGAINVRIAVIVKIVINFTFITNMKEDY